MPKINSMDNLIVILLMLAWVAYSFYTANQKKKQKELQRKPDLQPKPVAEPLPETKPQRSIFEEIFRDDELEDPKEQEPEYIPEYLEPAKEAKIFSYEDPETWDIKEKLAMKTGLRIYSETEPKEPKPVLAIRSATHIEAFDLRKAIIYNVILERPYH